MIKVCEPRLVLIEHASDEILEGLRQERSIATLELGSDAVGDRIRARSGEGLKLSWSVNASDPAYIMFTSGSTGFPKGAVMSHGNVLNFIQWAQQTFQVSESDVFTNVNPIYFDNSVFDFYSSLFSGSTLCPLTAEITNEPSSLVECINRLRCTVWFSVPSLLVYLLITKALTSRDFQHMRSIIFGGEGFPKPKLKELYALFGHRAELVNVYGPTECTCICSSHVVSHADVEEEAWLVPLGYLAPNFGHVIEPLDSQDPDFGELCLLGPNVGLGYYNDPVRTSQSFRQHPGSKYRNTMYRTGDIVRRDYRGCLYFEGRADNQIKHMGYRIELEEVEAALNSIDYINEAAVVYERSANGFGHIVAFVNREGSKEDSDIMDDLKRLLPSYMVPKKIKVMGVLPRNRNGKIDRIGLKELV